VIGAVSNFTLFATISKRGSGIIYRDTGLMVYVGGGADIRAARGHSNLRCSIGLNALETTMSDAGQSEALETGQVPVVPKDRTLVVRREGAATFGALAIGALALGAVAVGAVAIGRLAIGWLGVGRATLRSGQIDDLRITRLTIGELRVENVPKR
jgi:hypothetical protein